jgi:hypothetical protein
MQAPLDNIAGSEHFAELVFAGVQLLIPQTDIYSLEPTVDMQTSIANNGSIGQMEQQASRWFLYALDSHLNLLTDCPETYHIAILLKNVQPAYGLACEQIHAVARSKMTIHSLPTAMYSTDSPLLALAMVDNEVRYISSAHALIRLLPQDKSQ